MKEGIKLFLCVLAIVTAIVIKNQAFSYDTEIAHPFLAEKAVTLFNNQGGGDKLSAEQAGWIMRGAEEEDTAPRWFNHFYNPNSGMGLAGFMPANIWANSSLAQLSYYPGDQSYQTAITAYNNGDEKRAFIALGHVLHLLEDMAVPAHARIDAHPEGDPYEEWVKLNAGGKYNAVSLVKVDNFNQAFNSLASYSNKNFFSKDTLNTKLLNNTKYYKKNEIGEEVKCLNGVIDNKNFCLATIQKDSHGQEYLVFDEFTNADYYSLLFPKAISYGAGLIDLFFRQAKIEKEKQPTKLEKIKQSIIGTGKSVINAVSDWVTNYHIAVTDYAADLSGGNSADNGQTAAEAPAPEAGQVLSAKEEAGAEAADQPAEPQNQPASGAAENENMDLSETPAEPVSANAEVAPVSESSPETVSESSPADSPATDSTQSIPSSSQQASASASPAHANSSPTPPVPAPAVADEIPPETEITSAPPAAVSSTSAQFIFASSEDGSTFECDLDSAGWQACASPFAAENLTQGSHIFKARSRDAAGNLDQTPAEHVWSVSLAASAVTILSGPLDLASSTQADFSFATSSSLAFFECQLDNGGWQTCAASTTLTNLSETVHDFEIRGVDQAGNVGSSTLKSWLVDLTAPTSTVASLANSYESTGFTVNWDGADPSATGTASGLADFDLDFEVDSGGWQSWLTATTSTSTAFSLPLNNNQMVSFRSRARDLAGNLEAWPDLADASTTIITAATSSEDYMADHLVVSQISSGGGASEDFMELYNPTDADISLSGYSIQYRGSEAHSFEKKNFLTDSKVEAKSYFLIAPSQYAGATTPDFSVSFDLTATGGTVFLMATTTELTDAVATSSLAIDRLAYGAGEHLFAEGSAVAAPAAGVSLLRKAFATSTAQSMAAGGAQENAGNGYDSNDNETDFVLTNISNPRSANHAGEPEDDESNDDEQDDGQQAPAGLVHLWHFDECEGSTMADSAGSDDLPQNAFWAKGKWQCALSQTGNDLYNIDKTFSQPLPTGELTISYYWQNDVYPDEARNQVYLEKASGDVVTSLKTSSEFMTFYFESYIKQLPAMPANRGWHLISVVYSAAKAIVYVDAQVVAEFNDHDYSIKEPIQRLKIQGQYFPVQIDELAIWTRALSAAEISAIYQAQLPFNPYQEPADPAPAQRIYWWRFNEGSGATSTDAVSGQQLGPIMAWGQGKTGTAMEHNLNHVYAISQDLDQEINDKSLSLEFWWRNTDYPNEGRGKVELLNEEEAEILGLRISWYNDTARYYFDGQEIRLGEILPRNDDWHHLALVYDAHDLYFYFYLDGVEKIKKPMAWSRRPIKRLVVSEENWSFLIDELTLWRGALTAGQIMNIYQENP